MDFDARGIARDGRDGGVGGGVLVADLDLRANRARRWARSKPNSCRLAVKRGAQQVFVAPDDHALRRRLGGDDVQRLARGDRAARAAGPP